ncbi:Cof-type HAD-IIB family hydrolase [Streptomyces sp. ACA25]|uniref:Cof-type HAD-IIB family hydrolase n=1 Tax=Streptomyces sp. ACA25 TaxID=3022596 RepID=UPI002307193C|nr:Cof-type HAD-IIB family hydrolase [Streptomyces sp. ACA25]MDB1086198.1 Cof-type HAD-IIB family hydrolase [Streptomyces sp. ACA25]
MYTHPPKPAHPPEPVRPRLIATDLDGTLLRDDKTVSDRTVAALDAAERAGVEVVFVTGRPARWLRPLGAYVSGRGLAICANGAAVVDLHREREIVTCYPMASENALAAVTALRRTVPDVSFAVERTTGIHYDPHYPPFHLDPAAVVAPVEKLLGVSFEDQPILKLLAHHTALDPDGFLTLARETAGAHGAFTRSGPSALLEVSCAGVSKASTLALHCAELGIRAEEVVAFGDMPNDLEMLSWAGTSYAMANAHPAVHAAAARHTASNEEDGVAVVIEALLA